MDEQAYRQAEQAFWGEFGIEPTEERIALPCADGVSCRVQIVGDGAPVLFVHGGPNAGTTWAPIIPAFDGFRCLIIDRPGTGLSDSFVLSGDPHDFGRRFCNEALDALGVDRADVVASSFGGMLALFSAAAAPARYDRMVQMACPAFAPGMATPPFMRTMALKPVRWLMNKLPPNDRVGKNILRQIGHGASIDAGRIPQSFFDWYLALQKHTDTMRNDGEMIGQNASFRKGFPVEMTIPDETLRAVTTPTLFLWGQDDAFGDASVARRMVETMPNAELELLPKSGHLPWIDDPATIGDRSAAFLRDD